MKMLASLILHCLCGKPYTSIIIKKNFAPKKFLAIFSPSLVFILLEMPEELHESNSILVAEL